MGNDQYPRVMESHEQRTEDDYMNHCVDRNRVKKQEARGYRTRAMFESCSPRLRLYHMTL